MPRTRGKLEQITQHIDLQISFVSAATPSQTQRCSQIDVSISQSAEYRTPTTVICSANTFDAGNEKALPLWMHTVSRYKGTLAQWPTGEEKFIDLGSPSATMFRFEHIERVEKDSHGKGSQSDGCHKECLSDFFEKGLFHKTNP